jgi:hypothetical protein
MQAAKFDDKHERAVLRMINRHASENQRERFAAGLLPEDEMLGLVRFELFKPFASFRRWEKLEHQDLRHERGILCPTYGVVYETREPSVLTHDEWSIFKKITTAMRAANIGPLSEHDVTASASLVEHVGHCNTCGAEAFGRSVNIRIEWAGRPLSREYTLEGAP